MPQGTQVRIEVEEKVTELALLNRSKAQIYRYLGEHSDRYGKPYIEEGGSPSKSTIDRLVDRVRPADPSGPWSLLDADDDEPALVLDVLLHMNRVSHGRTWLSKEAANIVARLRRAAPDIPPHWAYVMATMYQQTRARQGNLTTLDLVTAIAPWRRAGPASSWGLFTPQSTLHGRTVQQIASVEAFITFLTELANGFGVVHPEPPEDEDPPLDGSRNQALT